MHSNYLVKLDLITQPARNKRNQAMQRTKAKTQESAVPSEILVDGFDHIEFYVGNAFQACYYFHKAFGFDIRGFRGLETGFREAVSYVLNQDHVTLVLTGSLTPDSPVARHILEHGDGVKTIALRARDARVAWETAVARGAKSIQEPEVQEDEYGTLVTSAIATYGETIHKFIQRHDYKNNFLPGFRPMRKQAKARVGLAAIDHCVGSNEVNNMQKWLDFYAHVFGFYVFREFKLGDISTKYSSLTSTVMANKSGNVKLPFLEPAPGLRKSQVQEYLDYYHAEGVQHIAISTRNIIESVRLLREQGVEFMDVPRSYYDTLTDRVGQIDEDIEQLANLNILVDREADGYLLQIFTKPVQDRPTVFFEVIQRKGASGFGQGNFQALFEAIELDQALRGNL
jgi:4-hydroxyphenylpyruvate dioxygenase